MQAEWEVVDDSAAAGQINMVVDGGGACGPQRKHTEELCCRSNVEMLLLLSVRLCEAGGSLQSLKLCGPAEMSLQRQVRRTNQGFNHKLVQP